MRKVTYGINAIFKKLVTIAITVVAGLVFVLAGSAIAAPDDKGDENNKAEVKEKIKKLEDKLDSKAFFNRNRIFDNDRFLFNRFDLFDIDEDFFDRDRDRDRDKDRDRD